MARLQTGSIERGRYTPAARGVNRFAGSEDGRDLMQLADSLKELAPAVSQYADIVAHEQAQRGTAHADELFQDVLRTGKAIKADEIAPHQSRYFRRAAKEQFGRLQGARFASDLASGVENDLAGSTDPADFDKYAADFRDKWTAENLPGEDTDTASGFANRASEELLNLRRSFVAQAGQRLEGKVIEQTYQEHQVTIRDGIKNGFTASQIAATIRDRNQKLYLLNPKSGKNLTRTTIQAVLDAALVAEDEDMLEILDNLEGGAPGSRMSDTSFAQDKIPEYRAKIRSSLQSEMNLQAKQEKRQKQDTIDGIYEGLYTALENANDPRTVDVTQFREQMRRADPQNVKRIDSAVSSFLKASDRDEPDIKDGLYRKALRDTLTMDRVSEAFEAGNITLTTAKDLRSIIRANKGKGRTPKAIVNEPLYEDARGRLRTLFNIQLGAGLTPMNALLVNAENELERSWVAWRSGEGHGVDDVKTSEWLQNAVHTFFARHAGKGLGPDTVKKALEAPPGTIGPQLNNWEKERVVDSSWLRQVGVQLQQWKTTPNYRMPDVMREVLQGQFKLKNMAEVEEFYNRQRGLQTFDDLDKQITPKGH